MGAIAPVRRLTIIKYLEVKTEKLMFFNVLRTITKRYPFQTPRASLLERLPNVPDNFGIFQSKSGIRYVAYPNGSDLIVKNLFWLGDFDPWVGTVLKCLAHPDEVVCDIGAYIGDTSLPIANGMGSLGHIYCFEPVPLLYECLEKNVKANSISCITLIPLALSDSPGKLKLDIPDDELGMSRIVEENELNSVPNSIEVNVTTFDLWMKDSGIAQVAVVKIDVEDHELEVLKGMEDTLSKHQIGSIVFERHKDCDTTDAVVQLLQRHGYRIFRIYKGILKTEVVELGCSASFRKTSDYVAVIEDSEFERRLLSCPTVRSTAKSRVF